MWRAQRCSGAASLDGKEVKAPASPTDKPRLLEIVFCRVVNSFSWLCMLDERQRFFQWMKCTALETQGGGQGGRTVGDVCG